MKGFKKGFTMIELIFVIVIIGILSSIAVPRLSASRDDARFVASLASLKQAVDNAKMEYTIDGDTFRQATKVWLGHIGSYTNVGPDGSCFCVYTNRGAASVIVMPSSHPQYGYFSKCDLDTATRNELEDKAIELGLMNSRGNYKSIALGGRRMTF